MIEFLVGAGAAWVALRFRFWARARYEHLCQMWNAAVAITNLHHRGYPTISSRKRGNPYRLRVGYGRFVVYDRRASARLFHTYELERDVVERAWAKLTGRDRQ